MVQSTKNSPDYGFLETAIEGIKNPFLLAGVVVVVVLIWRMPSIISASSAAIRLGRTNKVEVAGRKKVLASQFKSLEDKRIRKKRRSKN